MLSMTSYQPNMLIEALKFTDRHAWLPDYEFIRKSVNSPTLAAYTQRDGQHYV